MTEEQYLRDFKLIESDVSLAIDAFYAFLEFHNLAAADQQTYAAVNRSARFWSVQLYADQAAVFITLGRIFSVDGAHHSIHKVLESAGRHVAIFSKGALRVRKLRSTNDPEPAWVDDFIANAWEPTASDLKNLKKTLAPYQRNYDELFAQIRHSFAHLIYKDRDELAAVFEKAQVAHVEDALCFLYGLLQNLTQIFDNGRQPDRLTDEMWQTRTARPREAVREMLWLLTMGHLAGD